MAVKVSDLSSGTVTSDDLFYFVDMDGPTGKKVTFATILSAIPVAQFYETSTPSAPGSNNVKIYAKDNGSGKTQLMALFSSGAEQQIAIQP